MSERDDYWFEVWYADGIDLVPSGLVIVVPLQDRSGRVQVLDHYNLNALLFEGKDYEEVFFWLTQDDYSHVGGRVFPDDGWPASADINITTSLDERSNEQPCGNFKSARSNKGK
jgi:hypothetical protein